MLNRLGSDATSVDVMVVTPGGVGQQVSQFVNALRKRFTSVEFILPYMCMSAGTLWALSGDRIWMDSRAFIGPIDPQVRSKSGEFVPAQSILILLERIRIEEESRPRHYPRSG
jgi:ClpP class serine protease